MLSSCYHWYLRTEFLRSVWKGLNAASLQSPWSFFLSKHEIVMLLLCVWFIIAQNKTSQPNSKAKQNKSPKQNHKTKQTKISKQNSKVKTKPQNKTAKQKLKLKAKQNNTAWNTVLLFAVYWSTKTNKQKNHSKLQNLKFHVVCIVPLTPTCSFILGWLSLVLLFLCFCSHSLDLLLFQVMSCVMWTSTVVI